MTRGTCLGLLCRGGGALLVAVLLSPVFVHAASGTVSATYRYAWGNNAGWVNFAPTQSTVTVSDTVLSGYAWSTNDGWINLSPSQGGVTNDGHGTLGGFAWDPSAGWVSFTGVTIDAAGLFHGQATGANGYAINFDCANCNVQTTWRATTVSNAATTVAPAGAIAPIFVSSPPAPQPPPTPPENQQTVTVPQSSPYNAASPSGVPSSGTTPSGSGTSASLPPSGANPVVGTVAPTPSVSVGKSHQNVLPKSVRIVVSTIVHFVRGGFAQLHSLFTHIHNFFQW